MAQTAPTKTYALDAPAAPEVERRVQELLRRPYRMVVQGDHEEGYLALVPELPGCVTAGETPAEALAELRDAMAAWLTVAVEDGQPVPDPPPPATVEVDPSTVRYSGRLLLRMPKSLHRELAEQAEREGVSLNQLVVTHLARLAGLDAFIAGRPVTLWEAPLAHGGETIAAVVHVPAPTPDRTPYRAAVSLRIGAIQAHGRTAPPPVEGISVGNTVYRAAPGAFGPYGGSFTAGYVFRHSNAPDAPAPTEIPVSVALPGGPHDLYRNVRLTVGIGSMPGSQVATAARTNIPPRA
jgi:antitoxin HicB